MKNNKQKKVVCAITMGDPSGIGPQIILKALKNLDVRRLADFIVIGDAWVFKKVDRENTADFDFKILDLKNVERKNFAFGKLKQEYGHAAFEYLKEACRLIKSGEIECLVTAPVNKQSVNLAGYDFKGHTEYISESFNVKDTVMMLLNKKMRVALATRHIALKDVSKSLSRRKILETIIKTEEGVKSYFLTPKPRIAVCALNPHGSDNGVMGNEEKDIIIPAIMTAKERGIQISGPFASDTFFAKKKLDNFDAIICMYHDQGLIPLKLTGFNKSVNITLGLPFVRTSPAHGTAFDIAKETNADPSSFIEAIKLAIKCTYNLRKA